MQPLLPPTTHTHYTARSHVHGTPTHTHIHTQTHITQTLTHIHTHTRAPKHILVHAQGSRAPGPAEYVGQSTHTHTDTHTHALRAHHIHTHVKCMHSCKVCTCAWHACMQRPHWADTRVHTPIHTTNTPSHTFTQERLKMFVHAQGFWRNTSASYSVCPCDADVQMEGEIKSAWAVYQTCSTQETALPVTSIRRPPGPDF